MSEQEAKSLVKELAFHEKVMLYQLLQGIQTKAGTNEHSQTEDI